MVFTNGKLYFSDLGFCSVPAIGTVFEVDTENNFLIDVFAEFPIEAGVLSPSLLAFRPGPEPFEVGAGADGGSLLVLASNFADTAIVAEIVPERYFVRGRVNDDELVDISDAVSLLNYLFRSGAAPDPLVAGDINDDDTLDISDSVYLLDYLFAGGSSIPPPFPELGPAP